MIMMVLDVIFAVTVLWKCTGTVQQKQIQLPDVFLFCDLLFCHEISYRHLWFPEDEFLYCS